MYTMSFCSTCGIKHIGKCPDLIVGLATWQPPQCSPNERITVGRENSRITVAPDTENLDVAPESLRRYRKNLDDPGYSAEDLAIVSDRIKCSEELIQRIAVAVHKANELAEDLH